RSHAVTDGLPRGTTSGGSEDSINSGKGFTVLQSVYRWHMEVIDDDVALQDRAFAYLAGDYFWAVTLRVLTIILFFNDKRLHFAIGLISREDDNNVTSMTVADPALMPVKYPVVTVSAGRSFQ